MQSVKALISRLVNVHEAERRTVSLLFMHHFLQGFGFALVFIVANSLFLAEYSVKELPKVYILSGFLVLLTGRIYAWYEHHLPIKKLLRIVVIVSGTLIVVLWIAGSVMHAAIFAFLLLSFYQVLYLLYSLEFWGLSALVFDVRQSKRLFSLISAGDMPAKMLGYLLVSLIASYISLNYLIILAGITVFGSLYFLSKLLNDHQLHEQNDKDLHHRYSPANDRRMPIQMLQRFFKNRFIGIAAVLSIIAVITLASINFAFLAEVKYKFKTDKELASFFGLFFAAGQFFTIFMKAFFSGRVIQWIGIKKALLSLPLSILLILGAGFIIQGFDSDYKNLLYIYGFLMLTTEVLNYALQQPVFLSLFQPLNAHLRLHGHTVIKGFVDGIGRILAGLGILFLLNLGTSNHLMSFGLVVLVLALIWFFWVFITESGYFKMLQDAIRIRRLSGTSWQLKDERLKGQIIEKIKSGRPWEVIYHLEILKNNHPALFDKHALESITHKHAEVRDWTISNIPDHLLEKHIDFFRTEANNAIINRNGKYSLIERVASNDSTAYEWCGPLLNDDDLKLVQSLILGLLQGKSIEGMVMAGNRLIELKESKDELHKLLTCEIISQLKLNNFHGILQSYLNEDNPVLSRKIIQVASQLKLPSLLPEIFKRFDQHLKKSWYLQATASYGEEVIDLLETNLESYRNRKDALESISYLCQHIPGNRAVELLLDDCFTEYADIRQKVLSVISDFDIKKYSDAVQNKAENWLQKESDYLQLIQSSSITQTSDPQIFNLLKIESDNAKERLFNWINILYPDDDIPTKRDAYFSHYANKKANTLENMEGILSRKHKSLLFPLLEASSGNVPTNNSASQMFGKLLEKNTEHLSAWSLSYCLKRANEHESAPSFNFDHSWLDSDWKIIREQARIYNTKDEDMQKMTENQEELMELEKVSILKNTTIFRKTPENLLVDLAGLVKTVRLEKDAVLFHEGDPGDAMFIIHTGGIEIRNDQNLLATFGELDFFGELSLLDDEPRSATAMANTESLLLSISQEDFYELITFRPEVAKSVLRVLSQRLRKQNKS